MTPLDQAHRAMAAAPDDDGARLGYYEALAATELILMLEAEPGPKATLQPALFETEAGRLALAFDGEDRLAGFTGTPTPYAALPGRALVAMLAGQGLGLGVDLSAPSAFLMPADAVDWLAATLATVPAPVTDRPAALAAPDLPAALVRSLDRRFAAAAGLARSAVLAGVTWADGRRGHLLAVVDPAPGAEAALAAALGEAVTFSGIAAGAIDIAFLAAGDPLLPHLARSGRRFDLPAAPVSAPRPAPAAPGSDPSRPPKLR